MSKSGKLPLENAVEIIEKFGGIRPMASKTGVAVTTIQGWKKRGVIPGARKEAVLAAAAEHDVDLSGLVDGVPSLGEVDNVNLATDDLKPEEESVKAQEGAQKEPQEEDTQEEDTQEEEQQEEDSQEEEQQEEDSQEEEQQEEEQQEEKEDSGEEKTDDLEIPVALRRSAEAEKAKTLAAAKRDYREFTLEGKQAPVNRSLIIAGVIFLLILAALAGMVMKKEWKAEEKRDARIEELENRLSAVKKEQSSFKGLMSENWSEKLEQLKRKAEQVKKGVSATVNDVKNVSRDLSIEHGVERRVEQLQTYVSEISGVKGIYALKGRFAKMRNDYTGVKVLDSSVQALLPIVQKGRGAVSVDYVNGLIDSERKQNKALQASLGNVPKKELKAAAMLLAMTQVRSALNRPQAAFDSDLELLMGMVGDDDSELKAAIEKLAPHSKEGLLTPSGIKNEFQSVAGEAVAASLRGEDVSVSDKLSAKFNELLKVEKDGELLTGTQTQATVSKAEKLIESDRFEEAVSMLKKNLRAKELKPLRPWIKKVEGLIASKKLGGMIEEAIEMNFGSGLLGGKVLERQGY